MKCKIQVCGSTEKAYTPILHAFLPKLMSFWMVEKGKNAVRPGKEIYKTGEEKKSGIGVRIEGKRCLIGMSLLVMIKQNGKYAAKRGFKVWNL